MAGTPADLTAYVDSNVSHDRTYYGNGCEGDVDVKHTTPCANSLTTGTYDGETQRIGAFYTFQAASTGSGGAITTDNTNSPDTFCPLGWQLPYGGTDGDYYDQSKSWNYLMNIYNIPANSAGSTKMRSYPFSYIYSGFFDLYRGSLYWFKTIAVLWSNTVKAQTYTYQLRIHSGGLSATLVDGKNREYALRCD